MSPPFLMARMNIISCIRKPGSLIRIGVVLLGAVLVSAAGLFFSSVSIAEEVLIAHCLGGCPVGAANDNAVIVRAIYALSFNHHNLAADWVSYRVTESSIGVATNLSRLPVPDPYVPLTLEETDYQDSVTIAQVERTLLVPLVSFAGTPYWNEVNYLTNMVPRNPELNRGPWYGLEWAVRNLASRTGELYVIAGPLYNTTNPHPSLATTKPHKVPDGFFKVIATADGEVTAFVFDQRLAFHVHHCERRASLAEIERMTGLDLFPQNPGWPVGNLDQQLGCF
ncbi:MAG: DNA/RNA non-specific endonuclease [Pseudohongiellaceae bacterium]